MTNNQAEHKALNWVVAQLQIPHPEARDLQLAVARDRFAAALSAALDDGVLEESEAVHLEQIAVNWTWIGGFRPGYFRTEAEDFLRGIFAACTEGGVLADDAWTRRGAATKRLGLSKGISSHPCGCKQSDSSNTYLPNAKSRQTVSDTERRIAPDSARPLVRIAL